MRAILFLVLTLVSSAGLAEPILRIDKSQGDLARRLIREGDSVRFFCKPCSEVVYGETTVEKRELQPAGDGYRLLLNGEAVDITTVYVDNGYGDGWENLAHLLGLVVDGPARKMPAALDEESRLSRHTGTFAGTLAGKDVRLELVLEDRRLSSSYTRREESEALKLLATSYNASRKGESLVLIERGPKDRLTATWQGELDEEAGTFIGTRTPLDGSAAEPFRLQSESGSGETG